MLASKLTAVAQARQAEQPTQAEGSTSSSSSSSSWGAAAGILCGIPVQLGRLD